jgi:hypothetical protein
MFWSWLGKLFWLFKLILVEVVVSDFSILVLFNERHKPCFLLMLLFFILYSWNPFVLKLRCVCYGRGCKYIWRERDLFVSFNVLMRRSCLLSLYTMVPWGLNAQYYNYIFQRKKKSCNGFLKTDNDILKVYKCATEFLILKFIFSHRIIKLFNLIILVDIISLD